MGSWLRGRADLLRRILLERHGIAISEDAAAEAVKDYVKSIAERLGIQERSARRHVDDEAIGVLADRIAEESQRRKGNGQVG